MIHCLCNNINTSDIDRAASCGARTPECVQRACGSEFNCGACRSSIEDRLSLMMATQSPALQAAE